MTELSFLTGLLREPKLPKPIRDKILDRLDMMGATEVFLPQSSVISSDRGTTQAPGGLKSMMSSPLVSAQCASTQAILARNPDLMAQSAGASSVVPAQVIATTTPPQAPVVQIAQTQATMQAMASRNQAINESLSGKVDKTTGRPRKY